MSNQWKKVQELLYYTFKDCAPLLPCREVAIGDVAWYRDRWSLFYQDELPKGLAQELTPAAHARAVQEGLQASCQFHLSTGSEKLTNASFKDLGLEAKVKEIGAEAKYTSSTNALLLFKDRAWASLSLQGILDYAALVCENIPLPADKDQYGIAKLCIVTGVRQAAEIVAQAKGDAQFLVAADALMARAGLGGAAGRDASAEYTPGNTRYTYAYEYARVDFHFKPKKDIDAGHKVLYHLCNAVGRPGSNQYQEEVIISRPVKGFAGRSQEEFAENKGHGDLTLEKVNVYLDGLVKDLETNLEVAVQMQDLKKIAEAEMELNGLHRAHELVELRASLSEDNSEKVHALEESVQSLKTECAGLCKDISLLDTTQKEQTRDLCTIVHRVGEVTAYIDALAKVAIASQDVPTFKEKYTTAAEQSALKDISSVLESWQRLHNGTLATAQAKVEAELEAEAAERQRAESASLVVRPLYTLDA